MMDKERRIKAAGNEVTVFHLTVNSNKGDDQYRQKLKDAMDGFFHNLETHFIKHNPKPGETPLSDTDLQARISDIKIEAALERNEREKPGTKNWCWHVHAAIRIEHRTRLHLDLQKIHKYLKEEMLVTCYVRCQVGRDAWANFVRYGKKDATESAPPQQPQ